ncbi:unnamed protein product, partial [Discosporangium mesarthrocarpum]
MSLFRRGWLAVAAWVLLWFINIDHCIGSTNKPKTARSDGSEENGEMDEDSVVAMGILNILHDRTRSVGDLLRATGDTVGAFAGGGIKVVGATFQGLSAALDAASSTLDSHPGPGQAREKGQHPSLSSPSSSRQGGRPRPQGGGPQPQRHQEIPRHSGGDINWSAWQQQQQQHNPNPSPNPNLNHKTRHGEEWGATHHPDTTSLSRKQNQRGKEGADLKSKPSRSRANPLERLGHLGRSSAAGSLRLVSTAVRGVGDAVFQAGAVAEGFAAGTGQLAEDLVRVVEEALEDAREDIVRISGPQRDKEGPNPRSGHYGAGFDSPEAAPGLMNPSLGDSAQTKVDGVAPLGKEGNVSTPPEGPGGGSAWGWCTSMLVSIWGVLVRESEGIFTRTDGVPPVAPGLGAVLAAVSLLFLW